LHTFDVTWETRQMATFKALCSKVKCEPTFGARLAWDKQDKWQQQAHQDFEEWARDLGFDPDSRKAEGMYKAVQASTAKLSKLLGEDFDAFMRAERS
jgi:hypothetical protein